MFNDGNMSCTTSYNNNIIIIIIIIIDMLETFICLMLTLNFETLSVDKKNQLDVTFCILYFSSNSCSTCFGQPCAHHQELTTA